MSTAVDSGCMRVGRCGSWVVGKPVVAAVGSIPGDIGKVTSGEARGRSLRNQRIPKNWLEVTMEPFLPCFLWVVLSSNSEMVKQTSEVKTLLWVLRSLEL